MAIKYDSEPDDIKIGYPTPPPSKKGTPILIVKLYSTEIEYINARSTLHSCYADISKAIFFASSILKFANDKVKDTVTPADTSTILIVKLQINGDDIVRNKICIDRLSTTETNEMVIDLCKLIELE